MCLEVCKQGITVFVCGPEVMNKSTSLSTCFLDWGISLLQELG